MTPDENDIRQSRSDSKHAHEGSVAIQVSDSPSDPLWDQFVEGSPDGHHVQTTAWGRLKGFDGWKAIRISAYGGDTLVGGAQVLLRELPVGGHIGYVPKGPVVAYDSPDLGSALLDAFDDVVREWKIRHITVQPSDRGHAMSADLAHRGYRASQTPVAPVATVQVDLRQEPEEILASMRKNHRRFVRFGLKNGIVGRTGDRADLPAFHGLVEATAIRQGFTPHSLGHFNHLWDLFDATGKIQLFLVELDGQLVSGQIAIGFADRLTAKNSGWTGEHGRLGPNYVMEWTTMLWGRERGFARYDLEGIDVRAARIVLEGSPLPDEFKRSHSFYKLGFGGEVSLFPQAQVWIPNPVIRNGYWTLYPRLARYPVVKRMIARARGGATG